MTDFISQFDRDLERVSEHLPETLTWSGSDYRCNVEERGQGQEVDDLAIWEQYDFTVHVRNALFTGARPKRGDKVTISSVNYRIEKATDSPDHTVLRLDLKEVT